MSKEDKLLRRKYIKAQLKDRMKAPFVYERSKPTGVLPSFRIHDAGDDPLARTNEEVYAKEIVNALNLMHAGCSCGHVHTKRYCGHVNENGDTCICDETPPAQLRYQTAVCRFVNSQGLHLSSSWKEYLAQEFELIEDESNPYRPLIPRRK